MNILATLPVASDDPAFAESLLTMGVGWPEKVARTVLVYLGIAVILRLAGKRLLAQMNSLDLVVVLLLSNVVQNAIIGPDNSLLGGLMGAVVLVAFNSGLERLSARWQPLRRVVEASETRVVENGVVDLAACERLGVSPLELDAALRNQGADSVDEVALATLGPGGTLTVDRRREDQAASYGELRAAVAELSAKIDGLARR